jgi:gliding motility-associated-like protein
MLHAQQPTRSDCPGVPGACGYTADPSTLHSGPTPTPQNGNGTLGLVYTNTACGLNYATAAKVLGKRFSPQGVNQPAAFNITGIPAGACILKAYLWAEGSGDGSAQTATIVNPSSVSGNYPMAVVGQGPDKCWGYAGSYTYRADVTPCIAGNGNYNISGILTNPPTSGNDMDGATLLVIWSDASQAWRGTIRVDDGAYVVNGGIANYVMTYPAVCGATTNASAFMCVGDIQFNPTSWTLNGTAGALTWNWWDLVKVNTTVASGQTTSAFNVNTGGDCFNLCVAGLYYRTTCVACTPTTLTMSSTPATCSGCNGTATVTVNPAGSYTYTWSPSGGTGTTATGLCAGTYTVTAVSGCNTYTASVVVANAGGGLTVSGTQTNVTCFGACNGTASTTVSGGTAPYTFTWSPAHASTTAGATNTASALCAGTYTISVVDANGCTGSRTITITEPPAITATQSQVNVTCNGACTGSATVVASGGNGTYTYSWAPSGGTGATATGLCAGTYTCTISSPAGCSITSSFTITQPPAITATQSQVNVTCNGACNGSATVVASGGNGTYTYSWAPSGGTGATATGLCAGTYTCTISSPVGCSITKTFTITQPPAITATQSQVNVTCNGACTGSATVVAAGGNGTYTYSWAPSGGTGATATGLCAGTYTCTISSPAGCSITSSFTITQPPAITATQSQVNITCNGACNGSATVVASGGNGTYTYAWAPSGGTGATATGLCAGTYTCTISSPVGCSITKTFTITQPPAITATQSQVNVTCNGACTGSATVVASGGNGTYTYAWAPSGGTAATATGLCAGTYTCTISSPVGCSITSSFTITQPPAITATQSQVNVTCFGSCNGSATVVASGGNGTYTYAWAPSGGTAATATGLCAGTYTCTISSPVGCSITKTFTITQPPAITATQSQVNVTCFGSCTGSATVVASGGTGTYTYAWTPSGGTAATASGLCAGTYTCTISSPAGCSITSVFTITQPPAITATQSQVNVTCNGACTGSATVVASGGNGTYTYAWAPSGGTAATASGLCAGTYTCTISSPVGCSITSSFTITQPPAITATQSQVNVTCFGSCNGSATVVASGGNGTYTYAWAPSGGTAATATGLCAGTYTCTISSPVGCSITKTFTITQPPAITATQSQVNVTCFGSCNGSATVVASGGTGTYTYAWAPSGGTGATATGLCAGTYTCTISSPAGCTITQSFTITQPPAITATQSQVNVTCNGSCTGSATVVASGGNGTYTYAWTPSGGTAATATGLCAGTYTCTISSPVGCSITSVFTITQPPVITATQSQTNVLCNGGCNGTATVVASGGNGTYTYAWAPSGGTAATATGLCAGTYTCTISSPAGCSITKTFTITQPPVMAATSTTTQATCGNPNGSATVTASGGVGPYTYSWAPSGGNSATATGLSAGSYTCTITDANGCTFTKTVSITNAGSPTATITASTNVTCFGGNNGSATVSASGGTGPYTYAWAPSGGNAATASSLAANTYTVTVTDANGCSTIATVTITQPPVITATQSQTNVLCNGGCNGTATVVASGGNGTYTYSWAPSGGTAATASALCAGTYTCTISSPAGCSITKTFTITQPTAVTATQSQVNVSCNAGTNGSATVVASGGTPGYTYSWAPSGGTGATATGLAAGTYTCTITDANGCTITKSFTITQPTPITATSSTVTATCGNPNGSATVVPSGGVGPYTYSWAPSGGTGATATGLSAGSYTCTITDANGCVITKTVTIINAGSPTATISASTNILCNGGNNGSATVTASGGTGPYTYAWTPTGGTGATASSLTANTYTVTVTDANGCSTTATVTLTQPPLLAATAVSTPVLCNGGTTGTATVTASGGTPGYTYSWAPSGGTGATASGLAAGTYTCTVTDANGCTRTASITVTQPTAVTATTATTPVLCNGGSTGTTSVTASGGTPAYTYSWAPSGGTGSSATGLTAGTYTCTITDANGCSITKTITVTQPTAIAATSTTVTATCGNPNGSATVTPSGGTPGYTYSWAPSGGTGATATGLAAGTYTCTITDANSCTFTTSVTIINAGSPTATISASTNILCFGGNNGSATVTASGGTGPYTYAWAPIGGTGSTASLLTANTYTVTVTDANGCSATASITLTQPPALTASATSTPVLCNGGNTGTATVTASGGVGPYTYAWAPSGGTGSTATGLTATTYTCTVTDANGCTTTATTTVTQPTQVTSTISTTPVLCNGGNTGTAAVVASGGTPGYTYSWAPTGGTGASASALAAGGYTCTITDANGCVITASITVTQPTPITATTTTVQAICGNPNGSATVTASGGTPGYTYSWAPSGGTGATATGLAAGTYTCTITDANGCVFTTSVTIINAGSPTVSIISSVNILCFGGNNGSATASASGGTGPYTYAWAPSGGTGATATGLIAGSYTVTATDANGCTATASVTLTQPPVLTASATSTPVLCYGGNTGGAILVPAGGVGPYTYSWAPSGGTGSSASNLTAGNYTCTVTDSNGCTTTASTTVTQPTQVTSTISTTPVLCNGGNTGTTAVVASGGTPGYTYSWAPTGGTGASASGLTAGGYTCTITDANGCAITASITVTEPTAVALTTSFVQSTCGNPNGQASVVATGGTPGYTYSWAPSGGTGATATGLLAQGYTVTVTDANGCVSTASVTVPNAGSPTAAITASTNVSCFGGNNGTATVTGSGGTPPFTYAWSPSGGTGQTGTGLIAGSYTVTLTDSNGCTATASVTITEPPLLTATATSTPVLCFGGNTGGAILVPAGGVGPYTYSWAPSGGTGATAPNLIAGNYTCTVTDANGCTTTASTTVTEPTLLTASSTQVDELCNGGNNASATVTAAGGTSGYTYSWAPTGGTNPTAAGLLAGSYTCTVTDANGCTATASLTITQPTAIVLTTSFVQSTCGNPNGQADVISTGGTPGYTYSWSPTGGTGATATGLMAQGYTVTVTDANGCIATASVTVPNAGTPVATITASTNVLCFGGNNGDATVTVTGAGTPPYNYAWSPTGGTGATGTGLIAGSYTVTVSDVNGCSAVDSVIITEPPLLTAVASYTPVLCNAGNTGSATVVGSGGVTAYTYAWSPSGGTGSTEPNLIAGSYTCIVTDANGCTANASTTVTEPTQLTATFSQVDELCNGGNNASASVVASGATPTYTYSWAPSGGTNPTASSLTAGNYTCTITDANSCFITQSFAITEPTAVVVSAVGTDAHCNQPDGSAIASATGGTGAFTYAWSLPSVGDSITNVVAGTYTVVATDANGCMDTTTVTINNLNGVNATLTSVTNLTCFQSANGAIVTGATGGVNPYTYSWSPSGGNAANATGLSAGNYTLTVTDASGCSSTVSATVTEPSLVTITASAAPSSVCAGSSVALSSNPAGGTPALSVVWTPGNLNGNAQNIIPTASTTYTATVTDANGCTASATTSVTVFPMPAATFVADVVSGCSPVCVNFTDLSTILAPANIVAWDWDFGDGNISSVQNPSHCYTTPGIYTVILSVKSDDGCTNTITFTSYITVFANPVASFGASPQPTTLIAPEIFFTDSSTNASSWSWNFGDILNSSSVLQNPSFVYGTADCFQVTLTVTSPDGCMDDTTREVCIGPDASIYVPNAFTPNGDGKNETFFPVTIGMDPDQFEMWIFDRWGNMIYYTDDLNKGWDGRVQGHSEISQIDTYVWKIKAVDLAAHRHDLVGKVSLIK